MTDAAYRDAFGAEKTPAKTDEDADSAARKDKRRRLFLLLSGGVAVVAAGCLTYGAFFAGRHARTDNAYVGASVATITPLVGGPVKEVLVNDTQVVKRGDVLVKLDDTDLRIALSRAEAELADTIRRVRSLSATNRGLNAQIAARVADQARAEAQVAAAKGDLEKARIDLSRRQDLAASGSVSGEELTTAQNAFITASANLKSAEAALALAGADRAAALGAEQANKVMIQDTSLEANPEVMAARAERDQAEVNLERAVVRAPVDGVISRRDVQVGQRVQSGAALMAIVPIAELYVDANFKEVQLGQVRPGQRATLVSDLYGRRVTYHGRVVGVSGGTGSAFAMVPSQNATGNWIKVVQRLPVRIALDPRELAEHPLRVGLSMDADIDLAD